MDALLLGFFVHEQHLRRHWHDFVVEFAGCLSGCRALLAAERVFVLYITRDVVTASDDFSCLKHRHIGVLRARDNVGIDCAIAVAMLVLDEADRLLGPNHPCLKMLITLYEVKTQVSVWSEPFFRFF